MAAGVGEEVLLCIPRDRTEPGPGEPPDLPERLRAVPEVQALDRAADPDVDGKRRQVAEAEEEDAVPDLLSHARDPAKHLPSILFGHTPEGQKVELPLRDQAGCRAHVRRSVAEQACPKRPRVGRRQPGGRGKGVRDLQGRGR